MNTSIYFPAASGTVFCFTPQQASKEERRGCGVETYSSDGKVIVNSQRRPTMVPDCTGDWARCSGSQSYLLTKMSIQIYSVATAAIPTVISQSATKTICVFTIFLPLSLYL